MTRDITRDRHPGHQRTHETRTYRSVSCLFPGLALFPKQQRARRVVHGWRWRFDTHPVAESSMRLGVVHEQRHPWSREHPQASSACPATPPVCGRASLLASVYLPVYRCRSSLYEAMSQPAIGKIGLISMLSSTAGAPNTLMFWISTTLRNKHETERYCPS